MKYAKPEIVAVESAIEAIATIVLNKQVHVVLEREPNSGQSEAGAYEADE